MLDTLSCPDAVDTMANIASATGISASEMATSLRDLFNNPQPVRPLIEASTNGGLCCCDHLSTDIFTGESKIITITDWKPYDIKPHRIRCDYCGVVSEKDYGICEHCGAPLPL